MDCWHLEPGTGKKFVWFDWEGTVSACLDFLLYNFSVTLKNSTAHRFYSIILFIKGLEQTIRVL